MPRMILSLLRRRPCFQAPWGGAVVTPHLWPLRSYLELGALPTAVPCARLHARQLVWEWGLNGLAASTELLISELATNAVLRPRRGAGCS
jgi:hypothetical protein